MYIYIYICVYIYIYIYVCIYIYIYTHKHIHIHMYVCMYTHMYIFIHTHVRVYIYIYIYTYIHIYIYIYTHRMALNRGAHRPRHDSAVRVAREVLRFQLRAQISSSENLCWESSKLMLGVLMFYHNRVLSCVRIISYMT